MAKLLREFYEIKPDSQMINELKALKEEGKPLVVKAILQRADAINQNKRRYPFDTLKKECDRYMEESVKRGNSVGCLDHSESPVIELDKVSHTIDDIWWEGKDVLGKVRILPTPKGQIAETLLLNNVPVGISSRALGSVMENESEGYSIVGEDLNLICWDLVSVPSTHGAFLKLHEAKEIGNFDTRKIYPAEIRIKETLRELLSKK